MIRSTIAVGGLVLLMALASAGPAVAGGTWIEFDRRYHRPGDEAVGTAVTHGGSYGWVEDGPFYATLQRVAANGMPVGEALPIGQMELREEAGGAVAVTVRFVVPDVPAGGLYRVDYCNDPCTEKLGDVIGGEIRVLGPAPAWGAQVGRRWGVR